MRMFCPNVSAFVFFQRTLRQRVSQLHLAEVGCYQATHQQYAEPAEPVEHVEPVKPVEPKEPVEPAEPAEPAKPYIFFSKNSNEIIYKTKKSAI